MKRYFNKALLYREWKNIWWIAVLMFGLASFRPLNFVLSNKRKVFFSGSPWASVSGSPTDAFTLVVFNNDKMWTVLLGLLIILLVAELFRPERGTSTYSLTASMPFSREEVAVTKYLVGFTTVAASITTSYIFITVIYILNRTQINSHYGYMDILVSFSLHILAFLSVYSLLFLIQTLTGKSYFGGALGGAAIFAPIVFFQFVADEFITFVRGGVRVALENVYEGPNGSIVVENNIIVRAIENLRDFLYIPDYLSREMFKHGPQDYSIGYNDIPTKIISLTILMVAFMLLAMYIYRKNRFEKNGQLFMFDAVERAVKFLSSLFLATLAASFFRYSILQPIVLIGAIVLAYIIMSRYADYYKGKTT